MDKDNQTVQTGPIPRLSSERSNSVRTLCRADFTKSGLFSSSCLSCSRTASSVRLNVPLQQHNSTHVNKSVTTAIKSWPTTMHFWNSGTFSCTIAASCLTCALYHVLSTDCDCRKLRTLISGVCCQSALMTTMCWLPTSICLLSVRCCQQRATIITPQSMTIATCWSSVVCPTREAQLQACFLSQWWYSCLQQQTSSAAVVERWRDALCPSVVSLNKIITHAESFIIVT